MKTYECIARSGNTGKEIIVLVRASSSVSARAEAVNQAKQQFGITAGAITIISIKEA